MKRILPAVLAAPLLRELEQLILRTKERRMSAAEAKTVHHSTYRSQCGRNI